MLYDWLYYWRHPILTPTEAKTAHDNAALKLTTLKTRIQKLHNDLYDTKTEYAKAEADYITTRINYYKHLTQTTTS